jgi:parallel beta-helix repeat protein
MRLFGVPVVRVFWRPAVSALAVVLNTSACMVLQTAPVSSQTPVAIHPGQSIQNAVNRHPEGTAFLIKQGVHARQTIYPRNGMSFVGEPGAVLDGQQATAQAIVAGRSRGVTVRGLRITGYAPPDSGAAVEGHGSEGWVVEGNEIDHNSNGTARAYGIRIGSRWVLRDNIIHHNGWVGIAGYRAFDALVEGNEVYANPPDVFEDNVGEAANIKLFECGRIVLRGNSVHDGPFLGIWLDRSEPEMTVEGNKVVNHGDAGIWHEVGYRGLIRGNYVENAGYRGRYSRGWVSGAGIQITNSPDVSVVENTVRHSLNGIVGQQASGYTNGPFGANELRNLLVRGNVIEMPRGQTGVVDNVGTNAPYVQWNIRFEGNRYVLESNPMPFRWMSLNLDEWQWQAHGHRAEASFAR